MNRSSAHAGRTAIRDSTLKIPSRVATTRYTDVACAIGLVVVITVFFSWVHGLRTPADLDVPSGYGTDGIFTYALMKAFASGEIFPGLFKFIGTLNAPYSAHWNDFPFNDFIYYPAGMIARLVGLSAAGWLYMLAVHVFGGLAFYLSARVLGLGRIPAMTGGVLFGLSPFLFYHSLVQATVFVCWHVPLLIVSVLWCLEPSRLRISYNHGFALAIASGVLAGFYNPYYWVMFLFLLAIVFTGTLYRRDLKHAARIAAVGFAAVAGFLLFNGHCLLFWYLYGRGNAFGRDLWGLVIWGMRLPDLITPVESRIGFYSALFDNYRAAYPHPLKGEAQMVYLGFVALAGLAALAAMSIIRIVARRFDRIDDLFWVAVGIFSYAVVGGINYLLGSFGFVLLRATNRHAVMLMAVGLFVVARALSSIRNARALALAALGVVAFGLFEQLPTAQSPTAKPHLARVTEDRKVAATLERELAPSAMVFQLPVHAYPETGEVNEMGDYDHYRPWLWTRTIRFSYGTMKGRGDADWQQTLGDKPVDQMVDELNRYGFSALLINRAAYKDHGAKLRSDLESLQYPLFIEEPGYFGFRLRPAASPQLPYVEPYMAGFGKGFWGPETDGKDHFRWSNGDALVKVTQSIIDARAATPPQPGTLRVAFRVDTMGARSVWVDVGGRKTLIASPDNPSRTISLPVDRTALPARLRFTTDQPGMSPGAGDPRKLAFRLIDLKVIP